MQQGSSPCNPRFAPEKDVPYRTEFLSVVKREGSYAGRTLQIGAAHLAFYHKRQLLSMNTRPIRRNRRGYPGDCLILCRTNRMPCHSDGAYATVGILYIIAQTNGIFI